MAGGISESKGAENSLEIESLAKFAVEDYDKKQNALLEFQKVLNSKQQVVSGTMYYITIEVKDGDQKKVYEAKVWVKPWLDFKEVPMYHTTVNHGENTQPTSNPNWTINVPDIRTIKVSNISLSATDRDIKEFFSFSGDIQYVEMQRESETTQLAYVTFKESQGDDTAMLLTGATIVDLSVSITPVQNYQFPPNAVLNMEPTSTSSAIRKAEDVVSTMLSKGFSLGKDALNKAKIFDEKHQLTSTASATVASIDSKLGLTEKLSLGTAAVNENVREMDERFQVSEKTKSAFAAAEQKASVAGSAIMSNRYVSTGASWVSSAFNRVAKAAEGVSMMTKEMVEKAEEERRENQQKEHVAMVNEFAHIHLDKSLVGDVSAHSVNSADSSKLV